MNKTKMTCHICDSTIRKEQFAPVCVDCGTDLTNPSDETIYLKTSMFYSRWSGFLILTNKRLMFVKLNYTESSSNMGIAHEFVGKAMDNVIRRERVAFNLLPGTMNSIEIVKYGLLGKALLIQINDSTQYKLLIPKNCIGEWKEAIILFNTNN